MGIAQQRVQRDETLNVVQLLEQTSEVQPVAAVHYNTRSLPRKEQFDFWREAGQNLGVIDRPDRSGGYQAPFHGSAHNYFTSTVAYSHHETVQSSNIDRGKRHTERIGVDAIAIQLRIAGKEIDNSFGHGTLFRSGAVRLYDLAQPFWNSTAGYDNIAIILERKQLESLLPKSANWHGMLLPHGPLIRLLADHMHSALEALPHLSATDAEVLSSITRDIIAAALAGAVSTIDLEADCMDKAAMMIIRRFIDENLSRPDLSPDMVARGIAVSRAKLFRLCRQHGISPMDLIRKRRLYRAWSLLKSHPTISVSQLAYDVGFEYRETFSRQFKAEFGLSVREALLAEKPENLN